MVKLNGAYTPGRDQAPDHIYEEIRQHFSEEKILNLNTCACAD